MCKSKSKFFSILNCRPKEETRIKCECVTSRIHHIYVDIQFHHTYWELRMQMYYFIMYCFSSTECTFQRCCVSDYWDDIVSVLQRSTLLKKCTGGDGFSFCRNFNEGKSRLLYTADHKMFSREPRTANNTSNDLHTDFVSNPLAIIFDDLLVVSHDGVLGIGQGLHHFVSGLFKAFHYRGQHQNPIENDTFNVRKPD